MRVSWLPLRLFNAVAIDRTLPLADLIRKAAAFGFDGMELQWKLLDSLEPSYIADVRCWLDVAGLPCSMLTPAPDFTNPDPNQHADEVARFRQVIDAAVQLGARTVRLTDGMDRPDVPYEVKRECALDGMLRSQEYAAGRGVTLAFENHWKDYYWERREFAGPLGVYLDLFAQIRNAGVKVNLDFSNGLMWNYTAAELYPHVRGSIANVHVSDRAWVDGHLVHSGVGEGIIEYEPTMAQLKSDGYDGWLCIEDNNPTGDASTARSLVWLRDLWERI